MKVVPQPIRFLQDGLWHLCSIEGSLERSVSIFGKGKNLSRFLSGHVLPNFQLNVPVSVWPASQIDFERRPAVPTNLSKSEAVESGKEAGFPESRFTKIIPWSVVCVCISKRLFSDLSKPGIPSNCGALTSRPVVS